MNSWIFIILLLGSVFFSSSYAFTNESSEKSLGENITSQANYLSPLQQFKSGIPIEKIQCRDSLVLLQKQDGSPACVRPETVQKLTQRGWLKTEVAINSTGSQGTGDSSKTISDFKDVSFSSQTMSSLVSKFGQPDKDIGSGIHIYVYKLDDSTQVWIGYTDHVLYVAHLDSAGNSLEQIYSENEN